MNTVWPEPARFGGKLIHAPASRPGSDTWLATRAGPGAALRFAAMAPGVLVEATSLATPKASVVTSASTSAMRSQGKEPRRRRVRCGTWRAFAIGPASLAAAAAEPRCGTYLIRL